MYDGKTLKVRTLKEVTATVNEKEETFPKGVTVVGPIGILNDWISLGWAELETESKPYENKMQTPKGNKSEL